MNRIFLTEEAHHIASVYPKETMERLSLSPTVYKKSDVLANPEKFKNVEYIFSTWGMPAFTKEEVNAYLPALKCIFYAAGTVRFFAKGFLEAGVKVFSAWAANGIPVAEYTVAQIVLASKGFFPTSRIYKNGNYSKARALYETFPGNYNTKIGIIGAGMIGKYVIKMLKNYKVQVLVFDPFLPEQKAEELGVKKCSLEELFKTCFVVSNHLADNEQTRGMLTGELFASMPQNATFINTGRGAQVKESELIKVLKNRPDLTAILDVTYPEPIPLESEFYALENCIFTPHIAGSYGNELARMSEFIAEEYFRFEKGENCLFEVTLEMMKTMA